MGAEVMNVGVLLDIGALLGSPAVDQPGAGDELLTLIHRLVPYAAASISAFDPLSERHRTLARTGYSDRAVEHLDTWFVRHDAVYHHMRHVDRKPLRWQDMPFNYREMYSAQEVFLPEGFREGVTVCLYTRDDRYTGNLHLSTDDPRALSDSAAADVRRLQCLLAGFADRLRTPARLAARCRPGAHAAIVDPSGRALTVPGRDTGPHLADGGPLTVAVSAAFTRGDLPGRFRWCDPDGAWHRVTTARFGRSALVVQEPGPLPLDLSGRELDVLTGICAGLSNPEIAMRLFVSTKTVAKHVEHILDKLGCTSRTAAAVHAVRAGLTTLSGYVE